jgi:ribose 5-phosphate isomerase B
VSHSPQVIAFGADHAGFGYKALLMAQATAQGFDVLDLGTNGAASVDYPDYGYAVAQAVADERAALGVLVCGSGIGIAIAANRHPKARAALCTHSQMARLARSHNNANILVLGERLTGADVALACLHEFLTTEFLGGRHAARVDKLSNPQLETAS